MSGVCATCNVWLLGKPIYHCCKIITRGECFAAFTGIIQITCQAASAALILVLVLIFARSQPFESPDEFAKIKLVGQISLVCTLGSFLLSLSVYSVKPHLIDAVANFFGLTAAFLAVTQYFPQIYTTFTLKHAGTFSIPMMCIQTPGGYLWTWSLAQTTKWSTWLPYLTTAMLQNVLLVLAVYYEWQNAKKLQRLAPELHQEATETDALLPSNIRRHTD
ncbi:hypothetical protein TRVA0_041S00408 [Trichomonascus vanleenenianus]|uniref:PQ-loop repeat-containing protein n=1 Tax=Trichomonascus vanleenenianus TaxID=2268995 RepID=UPI003ECA710E